METDRKHCELCSIAEDESGSEDNLATLPLSIYFSSENTSGMCKYPVTLYNGLTSGSQPCCCCLSPGGYLLSL